MTSLADVAARAVAAQAAQEEAAAQAASDALVAAARTTLAALPAPNGVAWGAQQTAGLSVLDVSVAESLVVLTDGHTDLAVSGAGTSGAQVWLVRDDQGWTGIAQVASLADLGKALAAQGVG